MLDVAKYDFIIRSLEVSQTDVANAVGTSAQNICMICAGRHRPSSDLAQKIETYLKDIHLERRGRTNPAEVSAMVQAMLYPPPPSFDPPTGSDDKKRNSRGFSASVRKTPPAPGNSEAKRAGRGFSAVLRKTPPPAENPLCLDTWEDAEREYVALAEDYTFRRKRVLFDAIRERFSQYSQHKNSGLQKVLSRKTGVKLRKRSKNKAVTKRDAAIFQTVYPAFVAKRGREYSKGAYAERAKTSRRTLIRELFTEQPELTAQVESVLSLPEYSHLKRPSNLVSYLEKTIRRFDGGADAVAEVKAYQGRGQMPRAATPFKMVFLDASTVKADVVNGFGTESDKGYKRNFFFVCRDVATRKVWGSLHAAQSEDYGWGGGLPKWEAERLVTSGNALMDLLFQMGHAPETAVIDRKSGVATQLLTLKPDKVINVMPGVLGWVAADCLFHIRQGGRSTGGAYVERDIRTVQDYIEGVEARLSATKELRGQGFRADRQFDSEIEYRRAFEETLQKVNALLVSAPSGYERPDVGLKTRQQHIDDLMHTAAPRVLAPDASRKWIDIVRRARVGVVENRRVKFGHGRESRFAELEGVISGLEGPIADYSGEEAISIAIPGGMLASDTPDLVRVYIIDRRDNRLPRILRATAHVARVDELMHPVSRPQPGHYCARPDREVDEIAKGRDGAKAAWKETVDALKPKEATTGRII